MVQRFHPGDQVMVLDYRSRGNRQNNWRSSESWRGPLTVVKQQSKHGSQVRYRSSVTYEDDERGSYVLVKGVDHTYKCNYCEGEGKVLPEGFDPAATHRVKCEHCDGTGDVLILGYQERFLNRKDKILLVETYNSTIGAAAIRETNLRTEMARQKEQRETTMISDLIAAIDEAEDMPEPESILERRELAAAKFIKTRSREELFNSAARYVKRVQEAVNA